MPEETTQNTELRILNQYLTYEKIPQIEKGIKELKNFADNTFNKDVRRIFAEEQARREIYQFRRITLTSAQILALNTTVVTLVPAFLLSTIIVEGITARLNFNTTAYTGSNALEFRYTGASGAKVTADMASTFINSGSTAYRQVAGVEAELIPVINAPIIAVVPTANPGAGNSTMDLFIKFRVITF